MNKVNKIYTISGNVTYEDKVNLIIISADKNGGTKHIANKTLIIK